MCGKKLWFGLWAILIVISMLLISCQPKTVIVKEVVKETVEVEKLVTQVVEVEKEVTKIVAGTPVVEKVVETKVVEVTPTPAPTDMRKLSGKIRVAVQGAIPAPGAPETGNQRFWRQALTLYSKYQPNVEVEIEDVAPGGGPGEQWCEAKKTVADMSDISYVGECNYFRPSPDQVARGENIAMDFKVYEDEINPYTGKPWKDDWYSDYVRLGRCTENGAYDMWTCQTVQYGGQAIWVNWDILKQFGYDHTFPETYTELYELADKINASGTYVAWDGPAYSDGWFTRSLFSILTMDIYEDVLGGTIAPPAALQQSNKEALAPENILPHMCDGSLWASNSPSMQEALKQFKRFVDSFPGGGAAFFDPARSQGSELWLAGQAAMDYHTQGLYGAILQAMTDGVFAVEDWGVVTFPKLTKEDLFNKDLPIYFEGTYFAVGGGSGDVFAPTPNVRASGEDPNVDLIVRDFFQFMSSAEVSEIRARETGAISLNPDVSQELDPRLAGWQSVRDPMFDGVTQPPGTYANYIVYTHDPEFNIRAWLSGQLAFEEAMKAADENATQEWVRRMTDTLKARGEDLPDVCKEWATK